MARKILVCNNKGGAGKTTTVVNLAHALATTKGSKANQVKLLLIDLDHQCHVSEHLLRNEQQKGMYEFLFTDKPIHDLVTPAYDLGFDLLLNYHDFWNDWENALIDGGHEGKINNRLAQRLREIEDDYHFILMDSCPNMSTLNAWAIEASDWLLIPTNPRYFNMVGLKYMRKMARRYNRGDRSILGIIPTMVRNLREINDNLDLLHNSLETIRVAPSIRQYQDFSTAQAKGKTILQYKPRSNGAKDIMTLKSWIIKTIAEEERRSE